MTALSRVACLLGLVFLAACGGGSGQTADESQARVWTGMGSGASTNVQYQLVDADAYSGISTEQTVVIQDASAWVALWQEHKKNRSPVPPLPVIDFSQHAVFGVFLGSRPNGCYAVEIKRVYLQNETVFVEYAEHQPDDGALCTQALTAPSQLIAVPRTDRPVRFLKLA